jgi:hypothetical protein
VKALRALGALLSIAVFRELPKLSELASAAVMVVGLIVLLLREQHSHPHSMTSYSMSIFTFTTNTIGTDTKEWFPNRIRIRTNIPR